MSIVVMNVPDIDKYDLSSVRAFTSGAAPTPEELKRNILKYFPNAGYYEGYGMTETGTITQLNPEDSLRKEMCAGIPYHNVRMRLVDDDDNDVPVGEIGEVVVQGPQVILEYYKDPERTAEETTGGWFHTGDLGKLDNEGFLYLVDRKKDMIITGAENVYSAEVESALFAHPKVLEAAAIGLPDEKWGERVAAVIVLKKGQKMKEQELIDFCRDQLAHYKSPKQVIFLNDPLPRTSSGKVLKRELRAKFS
jgi:acyl-CoA synthetase (AMP-forming)/AMP-acid ligase II